MTTALAHAPTDPQSPRLLTAADLAALPTRLPTGDVRYELNDGELVVMAPPGDEHAARQAKIIRYLDSDAGDRGLGEVRGEVGIVLRRNPDRVVGADAAFILAKSLPPRVSPEGYLETIPELVVEVRSKNDTGPEVAAKVQEYLAAGVLLVWVLDPDGPTVTAHRLGQPERVFAAADTLACDDLLPGFAVPVARLFPA
jgi:Uma2 family endonuclease